MVEGEEGKPSASPPFFPRIRNASIPRADASADTSAASTTGDSLTDSWPHLQCIEKRRGGFRSISKTPRPCSRRPGHPDIEFYSGRFVTHAASGRAWRADLATRRDATRAKRSDLTFKTFKASPPPPFWFPVVRTPPSPSLPSPLSRRRARRNEPDRII